MNWSIGIFDYDCKIAKSLTVHTEISSRIVGKWPAIWPFQLDAIFARKIILIQKGDTEDVVEGDSFSVLQDDTPVWQFHVAYRVLD